MTTEPRDTRIRIEVVRLRVPLVRPYKLAFGPVTAFDTLVVLMHDDTGRHGAGEATLLTGYTDETIEGAWDGARALATALAGASAREVARKVLAVAPSSPFLATAFMTALDTLHAHPLLTVDAPTRVPILGILNETDDGALEAEIERLVSAGYRTLKVKVGFDVESDLRRVALIQARVAGRARLRLDANQGYTAQQARRFAGALDPAGIELFEQPCAAGDWDAHMSVVPHSTVPLMLDESIYGLADIERAARLGAARYVKVKLMKLVTLDGLVAAIERIRALGMIPVLGNGVACDLGCWMEACVAARHIDNAGEMNGFLKPHAGLLGQPLAFEDGAIVLQPGFRGVPEEDALARYEIDRHGGRPA
ncbi:MAG: enolase C-terminal domain-like protein [Burkholderiaceae bacterium]